MKTFIFFILVLTVSVISAQENKSNNIDSKSLNIQIYPTQSLSGIFKLSGIGDVRVLRTEIHELTGKKVTEIDHSRSIFTENTVIRLGINSGTYIASIVTDQGVVMRRIFVGRTYIN